jgi:iron(III) transport system permease protein
VALASIRPGLQRSVPAIDQEKALAAVFIAAILAFLLTTIILPLFTFLSKSLHDASGEFVGLGNYFAVFQSTRFISSVKNSVLISTLTVFITIPIAFTFAYALTRTCVPFKGLFRLIALIPLLSPTMLPAIALVYLFGTQGIFKEALFGADLYGPVGIVIAESIYTFPHALMILITALSLADARLYEAATSLKASSIRTFFYITIPGAKYGLVSASLVVFTLSITDFGIPKVIGGQFNVFATDIYVNVVGIRDFETAAVIGAMLLVPALLSFFVDLYVRKRQQAVLSSRSVPLRPKSNTLIDFWMTLFCVATCSAILLCFGMAFYASIVTFWPYNLNLTLTNYDFAAKTDLGWIAYYNSVVMAGTTALIGTVIVFLGAYLVEKLQFFGKLRSLLHIIAMMPMAIPGMVLGLSYLMFFNSPSNPLNALVGTTSIMVLSCISHFYTVSHLTAMTALKQIDAEFETVAASVKVPTTTLVRAVTVPIALPAILDVSVYFFLTSMTTISAIIFIFWPQTMTASIQMLFQSDNGDLAGAAALGTMIVLTSLVARLAHWIITRKFMGYFQRWRTG